MQATMMVDCPTCRVAMRHIEHNGATIELCPDCGGMFLDRGELEHLTQAEQAYNARGFEREVTPTGKREGRREGLLGRFGVDDDDHPHGERGGQGGQDGQGGRKCRGVPSDFLDFG